MAKVKKQTYPAKKKKKVKPEEKLVEAHRDSVVCSQNDEGLQYPNRG